MTPKFAEAVDPLFLSFLPVLERFDTGYDDISTTEALPSAGEIRQRLQDLLTRADRLLVREGEAWSPLAKYALVGWIDEMLVLAHDWSGRDEWTQDVLEFQTFGTRAAYEEFYTNANVAAQRSEADAMEIYYVCVFLGFVGVYRDQDREDVKRQIDALGLRPDLKSWSEDYASRVKQARGLRTAAGDGEGGRAISPATPLWNRSSIVWPCLLSVVLAGINVLAWWSGW